MSTIPAWFRSFFVPLVQLIVALFASSLVVLIVGENPWEALKILVYGAVNAQYGFPYTLYYATNFIFAGLAVAVAFHGGLFNIGGEGQAYFAGLAVAIVCVQLDFLPAPLLALISIGAAIIGGALWAIIPGVLQAYRGSHLVVTTIMFNFIAYSVVNWALRVYFVDPTKGVMESRPWNPEAVLPKAHTVLLEWFGVKLPFSLLNSALIVALLCAVGLWWLLWRTRLGYAIRAIGENPRAADYAGIPRARIIVTTVCISGALAGLMAFNEVYGAQGRLVLGFTGGFGFIGIAVALMGRNHPFGVVLAALVFGGLYQGATDLQLDIPSLNRDLILVIQGLVIFFTAATDRLLRDPLERLYHRIRGHQ